MTKKRKLKKLTLLVLIFCMTLVIVPSSVFAEPEAEEETAPKIEAETAPETEAEAVPKTEVVAAPKTEAVVVPKAAADGAKATNNVNVGDKIKYTGKRVGTADETAIFTYKNASSGLTFKGTCREAGIPLDKSGTGTVESRISNTSKIAKVLYKYAVKKGWLTGAKATTNARKVLGLNYKTVYTYRRLIESACQIYSMGTKDFRKAMINDCGVSATTVDAMIDWYRDLDVSKVKVPDEFEAYQIKTAKGTQPFTMWVLKPSPTPPTENGFVTLKKVSRNESITGLEDIMPDDEEPEEEVLN